MKKAFALALCALIFLCSALFLAACKKEGTVTEISVLQGSFRAEYQVDEAFDFSRAMLNVKYAGGETKAVRVTDAMLLDFDTSTTGTDRVLTVSYGGKATTYLYSVSYAFAVVTAARLVCEPSDGAFVLHLKQAELAEIFAVSFSLVANPADFDNILLLCLEEKFVLRYNIRNDRISVVIYGRDGAHAFLPNAELIRLSAPSAFRISDIVISDGERDIRLPDVVL